MVGTDASKPAPWESPTEFLREHLIWVLGLAPFLLAAIKFLTASGGNPQVFNYLLLNLNLVALMLSIGLPVLPLAGFWGVVAYCDKRFSIPEGERKEQAYWVVFAACLAFGASLAGMNVIHAITSVSLVMLILFTRAYDFRRNKRHLGSTRFRMRHLLEGPPFDAFPYVMVIAFQLLFTAGISWISTENITIKDEGNTSTQIVAQVISVDSPWTTILVTKSRQIRIVETENIVSREPCKADASIWGSTVSTVISGLLDNSPGEVSVCAPKT